jgi:RNA polymerase sigma-70 factor, ECF subfamily
MEPDESRYPDERSLVSACLEGDEFAWALFQKRYNRLIFAIMRWPRWRFSPEDVEDLCEEVYVRLIDSGLRRFQFDASLATYVATVARRLCIDRARERASRRAPVLSLDTDTQHGLSFAQVLESGIEVAEQVLRNETAVEIREAFKKLKQECRKILLLRWREGLAYDQIAAFLGLPIGTVGSMVSRCMNRFMETLRPVIDDAV